MMNHASFNQLFTYCSCRYDASTDTWTMVTPISLPRDGVGVCTLGDKLYAVGGYDGQHYSKEVECYDPILNEWTKVCLTVKVQSKLKNFVCCI